MNNSSSKPKIIRACTVSNSIGFVTGMIPELLKNFEVGILASPGEYWNSLDEYGDEVKRFEVAMERQISPWKDCKSLWKLIRIFQKERPDIVHSMTPKAGLLCMIAAWINRVPIRIHTFTGLVFPTAAGLKKKLLMFTDRVTCACASHIIPEGAGVRKDLLSNKITTKPIKVLGYGSCVGIDLNKFTSTHDTEIYSLKKGTLDTFKFITIGRIVGDKGINELVSAFKRIAKEFNAQLIVVGPYEKEDPLMPETIEEIENNPNIAAVGLQRDIRPWLQQAHCSILASYREGFPNVVIEAGAMGLPQIVTDINGANEIIVEGKNGTIVPPKDAEALYQAMKRMIEDTNWRHSMAINAREMIASRYDEKFVRKCLFDFYNEILTSK